MKILEDFVEASMKLADQAAKVAGEAFETSKVIANEAMDKGKKKVNLLSLESELAKAERQLGSLYYVMRKTGEVNEELLTQYYNDVAELNEKLDAARAEENSVSEAETECEETTVEEIPLISAEETCECTEETSLCDESNENINVCPNCGSLTEEDDKFCKDCGSELN